MDDTLNSMKVLNHSASMFMPKMVQKALLYIEEQERLSASMVLVCGNM